ncbi:MAG: filamentous hemagglutinin N-terminal domain-containing protein, partial [Cyanobacteria bacterium P01_D01_bin.116]
LGVLGSANLFLINPNGIIFGPNAQLSIGGSFVGTTADAIGFGSQGIFSALLPETPPLLTVKPSALLFNQIANQPITVQSTRGLQLTGNRSLFLVGGDVNLEGGILKAPGGRINLVGYSGAGTVGLNVDDSDLSLSVPDDAARADISLTNGANVETDLPENIDLDGSDIQVQGRRVTLAEGSEISTSTFGAGAAGNLTVNASESLELTEASRLLANTEGSGSGGELTIETPKLIVKDGSDIAAGAFNQGSGGRLNIKASEVELSGTSENGERLSRILTQTDGTGNAGELRIESDRLTVEGGAQVSTATTGEGDAGRLNIISSDFVRLIGTSTSPDNPQPSGLFASAEGENSGKPGDLSIETKQLIIQDGARALTSNLGTATEGGTLTVKASELVQLNGTSTNGEIRSGLLVGTTDVGASGELTIETPLLQVQNGAIVSARTSGKAQGGSVTINASDSIEVIGRSAVGNLEPSSITAETQGTQNAGNLTIQTGELSIKDGAEINSSSIGGGSGGNTDLVAESINLEQGNIISQTASGDGGNITINLEDFLVLRDRSTISSTAGTDGAGGDGGNITINAENGFIVAAPNENSDITANAFSGRGGRVDIEAAGIFGIAPRSREDLVDLLETEQPNELDASELLTNDITAISQENPDLSGVVTINALEIDP